jgi:hypothetical protein
MELRELLIGAVAGGLLVWLVLRAAYAARLASAATERDVLRERVVDLEATVSAEAETAALVAPLALSLDRVAQQVHTLERDRGEQFAKVAVELARVQSSTGELRDQTASLVGSLASANVRGAWGEVTLRRVLEVSGLLARCDFDEQRSGVTIGGAAVRPDVVVYLPGDRQLAVDAKAPMTDFLAAQADGITATERSGLLRAHAKSLRGHVDALAGKGYWTAFEGSPELVVCFVPGEALVGCGAVRRPAAARACHGALGRPGLAGDPVGPASVGGLGLASRRPHRGGPGVASARPGPLHALGCGGTAYRSVGGKPAQVGGGLQPVRRVDGEPGVGHCAPDAGARVGQRCGDRADPGADRGGAAPVDSRRAARGLG